jgi:ADP-heptose:LPS heptosyltransferase
LIKTTNLNRRALVVSPQGLGDLIMILPVLRVLEYKNIDYDILVKDHFMGRYLVEIGFSPSAIFCFNIKPTKKIFLFLKLRLQKYHFIFPSTTISTKKFLFFYFFICINKNNIFNIFSYLNIKKRSIHIVKKNLFFLFLMRLSTLISTIRYSRLYSLVPSNHCKSNYLLIVPGSGILEKHKRWPHTKFINLCIKILDEYPNINIKIIGSKDDAELCHKIFNQVITVNYGYNLRIKSLTTLTSMSDILSIYSDALLAIVNCNGGSHIAGFSGIPIVGLYGPTNPYITGPLTRNLKIIKSTMPCSPCYSERTPYGCGNPICMDSISFNEVWYWVRKHLG